MEIDKPFLFYFCNEFKSKADCSLHMLMKLITSEWREGMMSEVSFVASKHHVGKHITKLIATHLSDSYFHQCVGE